MFRLTTNTTDKIGRKLNGNLNTFWLQTSSNNRTKFRSTVFTCAILIFKALHKRQISILPKHQIVLIGLARWKLKAVFYYIYIQIQCVWFISNRTNISKNTNDTFQTKIVWHDGGHTILLRIWYCGITYKKIMYT